MTRLRVRDALAIAALALLLCGGARGWGDRAEGQSTSTIGLLAIDAVPNGNTATSLGPLDGCARIEPGSTADVDYIVDAVPQDRPMIGFEAEIRYDPALVEVVNIDHRFLLAAVGTYSPLDGLSDPLPDSDGKLRISVIDTASSTEPEANVETGPGVLARITFRAKSPGVSKIAIGLQQEPLLYPLVLDTQDEMILADRLGAASLAIGQDCPPETAEPEITDLGPTNQEIIAGNLTPGSASTNTSVATAGASPQASGGASAGQTPGHSPSPSAPRSGSGSSDADNRSSTRPIVVAALITLAIAGAGAGWYFYRRSRSAMQGD